MNFDIMGSGLANLDLSKLRGVDFSKSLDAMNLAFPKETAEVIKQTAEDAKRNSIDKLTQQILGQGTTSQWSGEGFGSAEANARNMAEILAGTGITDIRQFGKWTVEEEVPYFDEYGSGVAKQTKEVFGNKETKTAVPLTYASDSTAWGGTYAGKGNTGYRVQFAPDGTPYFYTTGGSSSDLGNIAPLLAIAQFIPGPVGIAARVANAAIAIDQGNVLGGVASITGIPGVSEAATAANLGTVVDAIQTANKVNNIVNAVESKDPFAIANAAASLLPAPSGVGVNNPSTLTPAQIEAGLGTPGYGTGAQAAASGLFDPSVIGTGAYVRPPVVVSDTTFTPDYSLSVGAPVIPEMGAQGIQAPTINEVIDVVNKPVDYSLPAPPSGVGLTMPTAPNLDSMGGGQGITVPVTGGTLTEAGVIPPNYVPALGDPESFINAPAPNVDVKIPSETEQTTEPTEETKIPVDKLIQLGLGLATGGAAANATKEDQPTGFPILPVPADWKSPEYNMAFTPSAPIDFGTRELLRGTQWESPSVQAPNAYTLSNLINTLNYQSQPFVQNVSAIPQVEMQMPDILDVFRAPTTVGINDTIGNLNGTPVSIADIIAGIQSGQNYSS